MFENKKSPGEDGLTVECYSVFWDIVGNLMVESFIYSYDHGELSNSQKRAIITLTLMTLIEKKDKDRRNIYLTGGRYRSLMFTLKLARKPSPKDWKLFFPRSYITINVHMSKTTICDAVIRSIDDILDYTKKYQIQGRLIAIDFKKAFGSVSRDFLFRKLSAFCFGPSFIHWIKMREE